MSDTTDDVLRRIAAEFRDDTENLPIASLLARLTVPLPALPFASADGAPSWVAKRVDGCPGRRCMAYATPTLWAVEGDTLVAAYQCSRCREAWWTSWGIPPADRVAA